MNATESNGKNRTHTPLVSIITPCYNTDKYVEECVSSVQAIVTCGNFSIEHIVVDDGSTDNSLETLRRLQLELKGGLVPLTVYGLRTNTGRPSQVRNYAISKARGKYIFCLDADDVVLQNTVRYFVDNFQRNPEDRWAYADFTRSGPDLRYMVGKDYYGWHHTTPEELLYSVFKGDHFYQHSIFFNHALFTQVGGYDPDVRMGEDLDLCARFVMAGYMPRYMQFASHIHRDHGTNMTAEFGIEEHLEDVRNHYSKHKFALTQWLTSRQISEIEKTIGISVGRKIKV